VNKLMQVLVHSDAEVMIVEISGPMDYPGCTSATRTLQKELALINAPLIIDLSKVAYMMSSGVALLLTLYKRVNNNQIMVFCGASRPIADLLDLMGFSVLVKMCRDVEEAKKLIRSIEKKLSN
jgi:anti-anti-sigma factor